MRENLESFSTQEFGVHFIKFSSLFIGILEHYLHHKIISKWRHHLINGDTTQLMDTPLTPLIASGEVTCSQLVVSGDTTACTTCPLLEVGIIQIMYNTIWYNSYVWTSTNNVFITLLFRCPLC